MRRAVSAVKEGPSELRNGARLTDIDAHGEVWLKEEKHTGRVCTY